MPKKKIVVIGGSAAGPKAAAKARRIDNDAEIVILQKEGDLSMASCGYPYYVGGYFDDRNMLLCTPAGGNEKSDVLSECEGHRCEGSNGGNRH